MKNPIYEFAPFRLDLRAGQLLHFDKEIKLTPIPFKLLTVLVKHHGQLVEYDELMKLVWGEKVVGENNLNVAITELRKKLDCGGLIENIPRRGYRFAAEVRVVDPALQFDDEKRPPTPGGALPVNSHFYLARQIDVEFYQALQRDCIVRIEGPRQVGKTSLLACGLQRARESGAQVVMTDFQHPSPQDFTNAETLLLALAEKIADQLDLAVRPHDVWSSVRSVNSNFERYLQREVLDKTVQPLVWGLDEIDRLFPFQYASGVFGLFRSWHNLRALEPSGPWRRLTLAMGYATEAHLFISDLNQSPFNVGTKIRLDDFTLEETTRLNQRYGAPLTSDAELVRVFALIGGQPYLTQRWLYEMTQRNVALAVIEASATSDTGLFGDHLRRLLASLLSNATLCEVVRSVLNGKPQMTITDFYHLRSAGVLIGNSVQQAKLRCQLYADFLRIHL